MSQQHEHTTAPGAEELRHHRRDYAVGLLCVILSAVFFATAGVLCKLISWNAWSISAGRSLFAALVMYIYMRFKGERFVVNKPTLIAAAVNLVMFTSFLLANKLTTAANTLVLQFTEPGWVILFGWLLFRNRPRKEAGIACAVIFVGIVCFFANQLKPGGSIAGELLAILSGATYAGVFLFKKFPGCSFESASIISFMAAVVIGIPSLMAETDWSAANVAMMVFMGVVQLGLAYVLLGRGLDSVSPVTASLTSTIEPVVNPILAAIVLGETLSPLCAVGAVLVVGAATVYNVWCARTGAE